MCRHKVIAEQHRTVMARRLIEGHMGLIEKDAVSC